MILALTSNQIILGLFALSWILVSLVVSMVIPRRNPEFPGKNLGGFIALMAVFFVAMVFAVFWFGKEAGQQEAAASNTPTTTQGAETTAPAETSTAAETTTAATTTAAAETTSSNETTTSAGGTTTGPGETTTSGAGPDEAALAAGKAAWDKAACGGCHTLAAAGATGTVGPNLDQLKPDEATVAKQVTNGGGGMPSFNGVLTPAEISAVAVYVSTVAGQS